MAQAVETYSSWARVWKHLQSINLRSGFKELYLYICLITSSSKSQFKDVWIQGPGIYSRIYELASQRMPMPAPLWLRLCSAFLGQCARGFQFLGEETMSHTGGPSTRGEAFEWTYRKMSGWRVMRISVKEHVGWFGDSGDIASDFFWRAMWVVNVVRGKHVVMRYLEPPFCLNLCLRISTKSWVLSSPSRVPQAKPSWVVR